MINRGAQFSTKEDGEIVENLTQSHVDPSKHRIFPDAGQYDPFWTDILEFFFFWALHFSFLKYISLRSLIKKKN